MSQFPAPPTFPNPPPGIGCQQWPPAIQENEGYTEDLCAPVAMLPTLRFPTEYPPGEFTYQPGRFEPRSTRPVRAIEYPDHSRSNCRYHYGHHTVDSRGKWHAEFCSERAAHNEKKNHKTHAARMESDDPHGVIPKGRFFYLGSYDAPMWADVHYHSTKMFYGVLT